MKKVASLRDAYGKALVELGKRDERIVVLDSDTSESTRTKHFARLFPERFFNLGIQEANMMGVAAGLASSGKIPFASSFAVFGTARAFEIIRNCICWQRLPVKIVLTHAGVTVGEDGASHQSIVDMAIMRTLPNMVVIVPADAVEAEKAIYAIVEWDGPIYVRLSRASFPIVFEDEYSFKIGKATIIKEGKDVSIIACGIMVHQALEAAAFLEKEGVEAEVVNVSTIKPIDKTLIIETAKKTRCVVTAEEHSIIGGLGSAVAEVLSQHYPCLMKCVGVNDTFGVSGSAGQLLEYFGLTSERIKKVALEVVEKKRALVNVS